METVSSEEISTVNGGVFEQKARFLNKIGGILSVPLEESSFNTQRRL
jgi:hypothetical protein